MTSDTTPVERPREEITSGFPEAGAPRFESIDAVRTGLADVQYLADDGISGVVFLADRLALHPGRAQTHLNLGRALVAMNRVDDGPPALDLRFRIDAGHVGAAETGGHHRRGFGDDQAARRSALRIIFRIQRPRRQ